MSRTCLFLACCFLFIVPLQAQMTVEYCQEKARENYPLIRQHALIAKTNDYTVSNAAKGYLPKFSIFGRASYQTEITTLPETFSQIGKLLAEIPGMPDLELPENGRMMNKDQYNIGINASQLIWDGGLIHAERKISNASSEVESSAVEVELYAINKQVNNLFFGILLLEKQSAQLELYAHELQTSYTQVKSFVTNGLANESDLDLIQATQYSNEQDKIRASSACKAYREMLSLLIGEDIGELVMPNLDQSSYILQEKISRPEMQLFDARNKLYDSQKSAVNAGYMPHISLFAHGGYGNPNFNFLSNKWDTYFIGGVSLLWNFGSLYSYKNNMKKIDLNKQKNEIQREAFLFNTKLEMTQESGEITLKRDLLKYDDKIIELRTNVKKAAQVKAENGVISIQDLMREMDAEEMARQNKIMHEIDLLLSIYNHKYTTNNP